MKVLFFARHYSYLRLFEAAITEIARRGHRLHLSADREEAMGGRRMVERLAEQYPTITLGTTPGRAPGAWSEFARRLRLGIDYLRYLHPRYASTPHLTRRARDRAPRSIVAMAERTGVSGSAALGRLLRLLERGIPINPDIKAYIRGQAPDVVIITPLVELGSPQMDHLAAAKALGIKTVLAVASWDHLSSKALIRVVPDKVIVWNATQRDEAQRFHGISADRVVVTGAQCFDQWFDRVPSRDRDAFCRRVGFSSAKTFLLYVCSALFRGSPSEAAFVLRRVAGIRQSSDSRLRDIPILIRPHPQRAAEWTADILADLSRMKDVVLWGSNPVDADSRADYFDSMFHAAAVVGLNTSALVESAIVDRPVFTILPPEFHESQEGTFHFQYLLDPVHGFLNSSRSLEEHVQQLAAALSGAIVRSNRRFVEHFVRPRGVAVAATSVFADAVEQIARDPAPRPRASEAWLLLLRPVIYALVLAGRVPLVERIYWNPKKLLVRHT